MLILILICREEWNIDQLISKVKEFIYLLDDLKSDDINLLSIEELKNYLQEQLRIAYDLKESQIEKIRSGLMREAERFFICSKSIIYGGNIFNPWIP